MTYTALDYLTMFLALFGSVFLLGLQSQVVRDGRIAMAMFVSFFISLANFVSVKYTAAGDIHAFFALAAGGCCGIGCSIVAYQRIPFLKRKDKCG